MCFPNTIDSASDLKMEDMYFEDFLDEMFPTAPKPVEKASAPTKKRDVNSAASILGRMESDEEFLLNVPKNLERALRNYEYLLKVKEQAKQGVFDEAYDEDYILSGEDPEDIKQAIIGRIEHEETTYCGNINDLQLWYEHLEPVPTVYSKRRHSSQNGQRVRKSVSWAELPPPTGLPFPLKKVRRDSPPQSRLTKLWAETATFQIKPRVA